MEPKKITNNKYKTTKAARYGYSSKSISNKFIIFVALQASAREMREKNELRSALFIWHVMLANHRDGVVAGEPAED